MANSVSGRLFSRNKWGLLAAIEQVRVELTPSGQRKPVWRFQCDCGSSADLRAYDVISGRVKSCGCLRKALAREKKTTHGEAAQMTLTYRSWRNMLTRGRNPNIKDALNYKLKGITVCPEWLPGEDGKGYERFLAHVGERPSSRHSLDRIDNDKGYMPGNVRWADGCAQARNKGNNRLIEYQGETVPLAVAADRSGIKIGVLRDRIFKLKWPPERWFEPRARAAFGTGKRSRPGVKARFPTPP